MTFFGLKWPFLAWNDHFWLKMTVKSGLEKNILKFYKCLLTCQANSAFLGRLFCTGNLKKKSEPLFTIILKSKIVSNLCMNFLCIVLHQKPTVQAYLTTIACFCHPRQTLFLDLHVLFMYNWQICLFSHDSVHAMKMKMITMYSYPLSQSICAHYSNFEIIGCKIWGARNGVRTFWGLRNIRLT